MNVRVIMPCQLMHLIKKRYLWMDFEFCQMSFIKIVLSGKVDELHEEPDIEIEFEYSHFIATVFLLHTDTS